MPRQTLATVLMALVCGCAAGRGPSHPDRTLAMYVEALERGELEDAYSLLSARQREAMDLAAFRRAAEQSQEEVQDQARQLRRHLAEPVPVTAVVRGPNGESATLVLQSGRWRIAEGAAGAVDLESPERTVAALRQALERRSYSAVLRLLSRETRAQIEDEVARIIEGLGSEDGLVIELTGNRARVRYDGDHFIDLVREHGEWVVNDMD